MWYWTSGWGIYRIINCANERVYIGETTRLSVRWYEHRSLLLRNTHPCRPLLRDWNKYGDRAFAFEVIEYLSRDMSKKERLVRERAHIVTYKMHMCYNPLRW